MKKILSLILAAACLLCFPVVSEADECAHEQKTITVTQAPVCAPGRAEITCAVCGAKLSDEIMKAVHTDDDNDAVCDLCGYKTESYIRFSTDCAEPAAGAAFNVSAYVCGIGGIASGKVQTLYDSSAVRLNSVDCANYGGLSANATKSSVESAFTGNTKLFSYTMKYSGADSSALSRLFTANFTALKAGCFLPDFFGSVLCDAQGGETAGYGVFSAGVYAGGKYDPLKVYVGGQRYLLGDVNGDGEIKSGDARLALMACAGTAKLSYGHRIAADIDHDGEVRANDARAIIRISAGLDSAEKHPFPKTLPVYPDESAAPRADLRDNVTSVQLAPGGSAVFFVDTVNAGASSIETVLDEKADGIGIESVPVPGGYRITVKADDFVTARGRKTTAVVNGEEREVKLSYAWLYVTVKSGNKALLRTRIRIYIGYGSALNAAAADAGYCKSFFDTEGDKDNYYVYWAFCDTDGKEYYALPSEGTFTVTENGASLGSVSRRVKTAAEFGEYDWNGQKIRSARIAVPKSSLKHSASGNADVGVSVRTPWATYSYTYDISGIG